MLAIVGESGSGKSVTAQTIIGLTRSPNSRIEGSVQAATATSCSTPSEAELQQVRGDRIAMVFQDPMTSFNPVYRIGDQIVEAIRAHRGEIDKARGARAGGRAARLGRHPRRRAGGSTTTRTSSPAACASGR